MNKQTVMTHLGAVIIDGKLNPNYNIAYIPELFGDALPIESVRPFITCLITLPGYKDAELNPTCHGTMLTWKEYGRCVATALKSINQPFTLVGSSKGAMIAIYTAVLVPNLVTKLVLYRIPRFQSLRENLQKKYAGIAQSIIDEVNFYKFLDKIRDKTSYKILQNLEHTGWEISKKLYMGASVSELDLEVFKNVTQPIILLEQDFLYDDLHPKEALENLLNYKSTKTIKKIDTIENAFLVSPGNLFDS
ncbi:hypothetical protein [Moorena sp. SIO4G3]|uniref:alpha/beta fold hydrolase n=1 Tax=Moorena sp. SIO4G3 TaxID=2607821 RepID=UPI00142B0ABB|nr:hypothetical protein [Moorena sp. SIO4G3]NEO76510.1 hypothetical protein [Moorena sp. SIO4G3]